MIFVIMCILLDVLYECSLCREYKVVLLGVQTAASICKNSTHGCDVIIITTPRLSKLLPREAINLFNSVPILFRAA